MDQLFKTIQITVVCAALLGIAFSVLLSLPQSQLRAFLLPIVGWGVAILCGLMCLSPVDLMPELVLGPVGLLDDVAYVAAGIAAAHVAMKSEK